MRGVSVWHVSFRESLGLSGLPRNTTEKRLTNPNNHKTKGWRDMRYDKFYGPIETGYDPMNPEGDDESEITLPGFD